MKLPVADAATVRAYATELLGRHRRRLGGLAALHTLAAVAGLAGPLLLGRLVDAVTSGTDARYVNTLVVVGAVAVLTQTGLIRYAQRASMLFGEQVFAELREEFLETVTSLPLSVVERAGTGDLVARTTNDVNKLQHAVRFGVPRVIVAVVTITLTVVACLVIDPLVSLALFVGVPTMVIMVRWYLRRATPAYVRESAAYAVLNGTITETVEGARTVDALGLGDAREERVRDDLREAFAAERATLRLRTILFPGVDLAFVLAPVAVLVWGGYLASTGHVTLGAVTTIVLYAYQVTGPVWELIFWVDEIQVAATALARIVGVRLVGTDREAGDARPADERIATRGLRYAYREGHDVLHGIDLDLAPGERLAVVGPSGAGKSTLGRMLAGIHPPTAGTATVGGVPLVDLPLEDLRGHVALVTQEHHVFVGTVAENLRLAKVDADDDDLERALRAVDAWDWVQGLPEGAATEVGSGGTALTPAQAQQLALARLVLLDPHTLVLDEATSLLDPRAARHLERSLSAVLAGRTVVAIAHRLHTAHDADRVAVVDAGRISEIGPHDELVAAGGEYAALWRSWQHEG
ncbi:ABC transporter ATP-binding protein [Cellulomonas sp. zg-ZUI222]|uniref:ABC transporter ATP-binding protein n=1 Tax=Cellulomonas wangleii TaxID=2816956 RepID=A0ABX8D1P3_9CELL|nr:MULTISPECIES: ABC transporter ATP-binding protein [Cellulomonas]MBO0899726.1 ABC transporter ATP-binding protein [Cellulomonas sp. zg-ZUI22]MBO0920588.1 ABC transporter ATP-binding protein [Cellulomonas wangleii]MBO0922994.1 ABC transporter ATP-binding protein [Cellulomonas wangleii]QVI61384.1 ABC transporter ATP-binding protein [Cellulomonas wangleii]